MQMEVLYLHVMSYAKFDGIDIPLSEFEIGGDGSGESLSIFDFAFVGNDNDGASVKGGNDFVDTFNCLLES